MPVKGKDLCRLLEKKGWIILRINGSHHVYGSADGKRRVVVPVHASRDLRRGTLYALLEQAGLSLSDLSDI